MGELQQLVVADAAERSVRGPQGPLPVGIGETGTKGQVGIGTPFCCIAACPNATCVCGATLGVRRGCFDGEATGLKEKRPGAPGTGCNAVTGIPVPAGMPREACGATRGVPGPWPMKCCGTARGECMQQCGGVDGGNCVHVAGTMAGPAVLWDAAS